MSEPLLYRIDPETEKEPASIVCLQCNRRSYHPEDIKQRYCGFCHAFLEARMHYDPSLKYHSEQPVKKL